MTGATVRLVYVGPASGGTGTVHRATCEEYAAPTAVTAESVPSDVLTAATKATCCSPRQFDVRNAIGANGTTPGTTTPKENNMTTAARKTAATASDKAEKAPVKAAAAKPAKAAAAKPAKPAAAKPAKPAKAAAAPRTKVGTFEVGTLTEFKCQGACGKKQSVKKFPTVGQDGKRAVECRPDRDARTKAEKEARAKAK